MEGLRKRCFDRAKPIEISRLCASARHAGNPSEGRLLDYPADWGSVSGPELKNAGIGVLAQVPVEWLKMPPCDPNDLKACIVAPPVIKVVWSGFAQAWPAGFALMKAFQLHAEDQQKMIYAVDKEGKSLDQAVDQWPAQHESDWQGWIMAARR